MRAAVLAGDDPGPVAAEFRAPAAGQGEQILRVLAAGLNPIDLGTLPPPGNAARPMIVGREGVGLTPEGRRVYFGGTIAPYGSVAEQALVEEAAMVALNDVISDADAIVLGIAGMAAWGALTRATTLRRGEVVLVLGATGVVGQLAVQAARILGAGRVVAAGRDGERLESLRSIGADAVVALGEHDDLAAALREAAGGTVDITVDMLWGDAALPALLAAGFRGRHISIGNSAGDATLPGAPWRRNLVSIIGYSSSALPADERRAIYQELLVHAETGDLRVPIQEFALDQIGEAWQQLPAASGAKLIVRPSS